MPFPHAAQPGSGGRGGEPECRRNILSSSSSSFQAAAIQRPAARPPPVPQPPGGAGTAAAAPSPPASPRSFPAPRTKTGGGGRARQSSPLRPPPRLRLTPRRTTRDGASAWTIPGAAAGLPASAAAPPSALPSFSAAAGPPPPRPHWCRRPSVTAAAAPGRAGARRVVKRRRSHSAPCFSYQPPAASAVWRCWAQPRGEMLPPTRSPSLAAGLVGRGAERGPLWLRGRARPARGSFAPRAQTRPRRCQRGRSPAGARREGGLGSALPPWRARPGPSSAAATGCAAGPRSPRVAPVLN